MSRGKRYTPDEIRKAQEMLDSGIGIEQVAESLGRNAHSLRTTLTRIAGNTQVQKQEFVPFLRLEDRLEEAADDADEMPTEQDDDEINTAAEQYCARVQNPLPDYSAHCNERQQIQKEPVPYNIRIWLAIANAIYTECEKILK